MMFPDTSWEAPRAPSRSVLLMATGTSRCIVPARPVLVLRHWRTEPRPGRSRQMAAPYARPSAPCNTSRVWASPATAATWWLDTKLHYRCCGTSTRVILCLQWLRIQRQTLGHRGSNLLARIDMLLAWRLRRRTKKMLLNITCFRSVENDTVRSHNYGYA